MAAAAAQQRLMARAAAAAVRWMSSTAATPGRFAGTPGRFAGTPGRFVGTQTPRRIACARTQIRCSNNAASPGELSMADASATSNGSTSSDKSMMNAIQFVKDVFSAGTAEQELSAVKALSTTVYKLEEKVKTLSASFWVLVAILVPSSIAIKSSQDSQSAELKRLSTNNDKMDTSAKALESRILALEYANLYAEKYSKVAALPKVPAPPTATGSSPSPPPPEGVGNAA